MQELRERVAVVTGGASGMGFAFARRFLAEGMKVVIADVQRDALDRAEKELAEAGGELLAVQTDVSQWQQVEALRDATLERFGAVHVVCNNAGVVTAGPVAELTLDDWQWVLGVNLWGAIHGVKAFLPLLLAQDEGHIISTASTAGLVASPAIAPYNVSKFGVVALMETVHREVQRTNVGASVLCPGEVATRITDAERNRPAGSEHNATDAESGFYAAASEVVSKGLDPEVVAEMVHDAIREDRFWILTHPEWKKILERRVEALVEHDALPRRYPG